MKNNKLILIIIFICLLLTAAYAKSKKIVERKINSTEFKKISTLFENEDIIEEHSFLVNLDNFENSYFISTVNMEDQLYFFYIVKDNKIFYQFPDSYGHDFYYDELKAVAFKDMNDDDLIDVIVITDCVTGIGPTGTEPFPVVTIYFATPDGDFARNVSIDEEVTDKYNNDPKIKSIKDIYNYLKKRKK